MRDLMAYAEFCMEMLDEIGVPYTVPVDFSVNTRSRRWGQCRYTYATGEYSININITLLDERNGEDGLINTLLHELLHTCPGCLNHGAEWKKWACLVKKTYGYDIQRTSGEDEKEVVTGNLNRKETNYKYWIYCRKCGKLVTRKQRECNITKYAYLWKHGNNCGGDLYCVKSGKFDAAANN